MGTIARKIAKNNVLFIEPNLLNKQNLEEFPMENKHLATDLEDLSIFCDLEIELVNRHNDVSVGMYKMIYHGDTGEIKVGIMQGTPYGSANALTTEYTDIGFNELAQGVRSTEMFGINSIKISYDAWVCPTVDIQFTDIRGISLFGVEEITHNLVRSDGMTGLSNKSENVDYTDSFFRAFFTFPYPRFKLVVKGFYGEPIAYDLAINNFKATFDSKTGNFGANVQFIGFKFGILNDLTMTSLASAVSVMNKEGVGRKYWEQQVASGRFYDGDKKLLRLSEITYKYQKYKKELKKTLEDLNQEVEDQQAILDSFDTVVECYKTFVATLKELGKKMTDDYKKVITQRLDEYLEQNSKDDSAIKRTLGYEFCNGKNGEEIAPWASIIQEFAKKSLDNISYNYENGKFTLKIPDLSLHHTIQNADNSFWGLKSTFRYVRFKHTNLNNLTPSEYIKALQEEKQGKRKVESIVTLNNADKPLKDEEKVGSWVNNKNFPGYKSLGDEDNHFPKKDYKPCNKVYDYLNNTEIDNAKNCLIEHVKDKQDYVSFPFKDCNFIPDIIYSINNYKDEDLVYKIGDKEVYDVTLPQDQKNGRKNESYYDDCGVKAAYDGLVNALTTVKNSMSGDLASQIDELLNELQSPKNNLLNQMANYNGKFVAIPVKLLYVPKMNTIIKDFVKDVIAIPVSVYELDLTNLKKKIEGISNKNFDEEIRAKQAAITNELQNKYLNFETGAHFIMKSLWAHVETFLHMCLNTRDNIRASHRTVKSLGLNKDNSSLAERDYIRAEECQVGAFPEILKKQSISGTPNVRMVHGWIGDIDSTAEECVLVNDLLQGASQYYVWANISEDEKGQVWGDSVEDIRIATYQYLKQLFEKWIHSIKRDTFINDWGVNEYFKSHFLFIDAFYNRWTNDVGVDVVNLCESCEDIFLHKSNTLLSFITTILQKINTILQPTQGFMINDIVNGDNVAEFYKKLFTPVPYSQMKYPESAPYFVVINRGDPSQHVDTGNEDEDDGFMVNTYDDNIEHLPLGIREKDTGTTENPLGYVIPAIGVSYGKQYQNYFIDVNVDMNTAMANEVSLAAQYELAGISTSRNGGGNEQNISLGQDLYTVYANNSYTCSVTMMGCMWIQPMMYFQLNNIPMFRGTYMIQKVTHDITPGNMITTFSGVRMSKYSSPFTNRKVFSTTDSGYANGGSVYVEPKASYDNDCLDKKYDPNETVGGSGTNTFPQEWLDAKFQTNFKYVNSNLSTWYNRVAELPTKFALSCILKGECNYLGNSDGEILARDLHSALIFNRIRYDGLENIANQPNVGNAFWNSEQWPSLNANNSSYQNNVSVYITNYSSNTNSVFAQSIEKVFKNSPNVIRGKMDGNGSNGMDETGRYGTHDITQAELQRLYWTAKQKSNCALIGGHKGSAYYTQTTKNCWEPVASQSTKTVFGDRLATCIRQTFDTYEGLGQDNFKTLFKTIKCIDKKRNNVQALSFQLQKTDVSYATPLLTDILLNVYGDYIKTITCKWDENAEDISENSYPYTVNITFAEKVDNITKIGFRKGDKLFKIDNNFPTAFLKVLKKKFNSLGDKKANAYISNEFI